jgi:hypothetical protein
MSLSASLAADSAIMLREAGKRRLRDYLLHQPPTMPLALETVMTAPTRCLGREFQLYGKLDRIDLRPLAEPGLEGERAVVVLDYKTGHVPKASPDVWADDAFWGRLANWRPGGGDDALLAELAGRLPSVQLPLYLRLVRCSPLSSVAGRGAGATETYPREAAWVELARQGEEIPLFAQKFPLEARKECIDGNFVVLLDFLLRHMLENPVIAPQPGAHCRWCSCGELCMSAAKSK